MNNLAMMLTQVNTICEEVYTHVNRKMDIEKKIENAQKGFRPWLLILMSLVMADVLYIPSRNFFMGLLGFVGTPIVMILVKKASTKSKIEELKKGIRVEEEVIAKIYAENAEIISFVPEEYFFPMATEYMLRMVQTKRAETLNEALGMFDQYYHRWKLEQASEAALREQEAQTAALKGIRKSSTITAASSTVTAAAATAKVLNRLM